ncbi:MAG: hypothetical protein ABL967_08315 [Bryobacteraceae bacterium]
MSITLRIGGALIVSGILWNAGWEWWQNSHHWVPADVPISFSKGRVRIKPFRVEIAGTYRVGLHAWPAHPGRGIPCLLSADCPTAEPSAVLPVFWRVSNSSGIVAEGTDRVGGSSSIYSSNLDYDSRNLGTFRAAPGEYWAELEFLEDGSFYETKQPRFEIVEDGTGEENVFWRTRSMQIAGALSIFLGWLVVSAAGIQWLRQLRPITTYTALTELGPSPGPILIEASIPRSPPRDVALWKTWEAWIAIGLAVLAVTGYSTAHYWIATRTFVPFQRTIELKPGHIRSGPVLTNLNGFYEINLTPTAGTPALSCDHTSRLKGRWTVYQNGRVIGRSSDNSDEAFSFTFDLIYASGFWPQEGLFDLDFSVDEVPPCLEGARMRFIVRTRDDDYRNLDLWLLRLGCLFTGAAASLLFLAWQRYRVQSPPAVAPNGGHVNPLPRAYWKRPSPERLRTMSLPMFGYLCAVFFLFLALIVAWMHSINYVPAIGLSVRLLQPLRTTAGTPGLQPVFIEWIQNQQTPTGELRISGVPVKLGQLESTLLRELKLRPLHWPVYVRGDRDSTWGPLCNIIDRIRGMQAEVTLVTHQR